MRIGILGGSFDPPHIGHVLVGIQTKELLSLDAVWLMPCYQHPFNKNMSPARHRLAMLTSMQNTSLVASNIEVKQKSISYTIDTLNTLKKMHPSDTFFFIIGSSQIEPFTRWKKWQEILLRNKLVIFPQNQTKKEMQQAIRKYWNIATTRKNIVLLPPEKLIHIPISSTKIRERVRKKQAIAYLVPSTIEEYIQKYKLYQNT